MAVNREKYRQAILYFVHRCANEHLGRTKLFKLLYYLDFDHVERYGVSVTGDVYRKRQFGPVGEAAFEMLDRLQADGLLASQIMQRGGLYQHQPIALQDYDTSVFSETELEVLQDVAIRWGPETSTDTMHSTHQERTWQSATMGGVIPYVREGRRADTGTRQLTPALRDSMIQYLINTQAIEGLTVPYDEAAAAVDDVYNEPLMDLG